VRTLEDRFVIGDGDREALEKEIVGLSLRFGVLCRFTAFVAVDRSEVVNEGGRQHRVTQPVEAPAGWEMLGDCAAAAAGSPGRPEDLLLRARGVKPRTVRSTNQQADDQVASQMEKEDVLMGKHTAKKRMLARQLLQEQNADGRVSKKTQLAIEEVAGTADGEAAPSEPARAAGGKNVPPPAPSQVKDSELDSLPTPADASTGLFGRVFGALARATQIGRHFGKGIKESKKAMKGLPEDTKGRNPLENGAAVDLTAYRRRALELLQALQGGAGGAGPERLRLLGILAVRLGALLEDLKSVAAPAAVLGPLERLHGDLQRLLAGSSPAEAEVARLWAECEKTLQAFAGTAVPMATAPGREQTFWK
jgi:hypothetical protein